jgi:uncharacterized LabA/DUF88 family protein
MDVLSLEPKIDVAVLVCGDGDFVPLVTFAKEKGVRVEVLAFRESASGALVEAADSFLDLSSEPASFLIGASGGPTLKTPKTLKRGTKSAPRIII